MEFKVGEIVRLNSGGPNMTIYSISGDKITCLWFDVNNDIKSGVFLKEVLACPPKSMGLGGL